MQVSRSSAPSRRTFASRPSCSMMSITASIIAQASGPPPNVVPRSSVASSRATSSGHQERRAGEARAQRLRGRDHVGRRCRRDSRRTGSPCDPFRTAPRRRPAARRPRRSACAAPAATRHPGRPRLPRPGPARRSPQRRPRRRVRAIADASPRGRNSTSKGACGKPYHFEAAPQVTAPAAAVRP